MLRYVMLVTDEWTYGDEHAAVFFERSTAPEERHNEAYTADDDDKNAHLRRTRSVVLQHSSDDN